MYVGHYLKEKDLNLAASTNKKYTYPSQYN